MIIKEYILENLSPDEIQDVAKHGCSGGVGGFIYYHETSDFHDKFEDEIWDILWNDADNQGLTIIEFIKTWSGQKDVGSMAQFKNLLCWYAVERICCDIYVETYNNE